MDQTKNLLNFKVTPVFVRNREATTRFVRNMGGTGSSKTYSIALRFIELMIDNRDKPAVFDVVRKTLPALRSTAMKDFFDILKAYNIYDERFHNKSDHIYRIGKSEICFFSIDDAQKVHGRKRDYLWINEANEISHEDFTQLNLRTSRQVFMDFNPSDNISWVYEISEDVTDIPSTYLDNPFLAESIRKEIRALEHQSEWHWQVYGLGKRAISKETIYTNWDECNVMPDIAEEFYGLDFGYNRPTALIKIKRREFETWEQELVYEGMTNAQLIERMNTLEVPKDAEIWADSEAPDRIAEIYAAGWTNIKGAKKGKQSVKDGIDICLRFKSHVLRSSVNLIKEFQSYRWQKDMVGNVLDVPVKFKDHLMDARRYAIASHCDPTEFLPAMQGIGEVPEKIKRGRFTEVGHAMAERKKSW